MYTQLVIFTLRIFSRRCSTHKIRVSMACKMRGYVHVLLKNVHTLIASDKRGLMSRVLLSAWSNETSENIYPYRFP